LCTVAMEELWDAVKKSFSGRMLYHVALFGLDQVGKSTLYSRFISYSCDVPFRLLSLSFMSVILFLVKDFVHRESTITFNANASLIEDAIFSCTNLPTGERSSRL
jgi:hypothetical protein